MITNTKRNTLEITDNKYCLHWNLSGLSPGLSLFCLHSFPRWAQTHPVLKDHVYASEFKPLISYLWVQGSSKFSCQPTSLMSSLSFSPRLTCPKQNFKLPTSLHARAHTHTNEANKVKINKKTFLSQSCLSQLFPNCSDQNLEIPHNHSLSLTSIYNHSTKTCWPSIYNIYHFVPVLFLLNPKHRYFLWLLKDLLLPMFVFSARKRTWTVFHIELRNQQKILEQMYKNVSFVKVN